jgi:hypothetical protein
MDPVERSHFDDQIDGRARKGRRDFPVDSDGSAFDVTPAASGRRAF